MERKTLTVAELHKLFKAQACAQQAADFLTRAIVIGNLDQSQEQAFRMGAVDKLREALSVLGYQPVVK